MCVELLKFQNEIVIINSAEIILLIYREATNSDHHKSLSFFNNGPGLKRNSLM